MREVLDTLSSGKRAAHPRNTRGQVLFNTQDTALGVTGCLIHLKHTSFNPESLEGRHHCHPPQSVSTERHWSYCWTLNAIGINEGGRGSKWGAVIKTASPWFVTTYWSFKDRTQQTAEIWPRQAASRPTRTPTINHKAHSCAHGLWGDKPEITTGTERRNKGCKQMWWVRLDFNKPTVGRYCSVNQTVHRLIWRGLACLVWYGTYATVHGLISQGHKGFKDEVA